MCTITYVPSHVYHHLCTIIYFIWSKTIVYYCLYIPSPTSPLILTPPPLLSKDNRIITHPSVAVRPPCTTTYHNQEAIEDNGPSKDGEDKQSVWVKVLLLREPAEHNVHIKHKPVIKYALQTDTYKCSRYVESTMLVRSLQMTTVVRHIPQHTSNKHTHTYIHTWHSNTHSYMTTYTHTYTHIHIYSTQTCDCWLHRHWYVHCRSWQQLHVAYQRMDM